MNSVRRTILLLSVLVACAGCSQTAALAPVGGAELGDLRYAVNDVLFEKGIEILVAPVCSGTGADIECAGETTDNEAITGSATSDDASTVEIKVGTEVLYSGSVQDVLDRNSTVGAP
ncbi:hypothetical protein CH249_12610 [Rhodococcus sp. 05-2255-3B1]|uniref:hypothetical protein n=1 Tax=unclassified Rhodococcus (in: high G+C Gram-positive bacteria) TaxID=192944 RepID=UPI000B9C4B49|nr:MULTISPECIES: hypothetical protein [unclassified Rhodococcus (in: high G+C Gram-positive bacteria)]OZE04024.1 hypothetical protein CH250_21240 [Rhodococcus sp. 05-2255-3C]OZE10618.1 hypothetical protein CH249_12610 [Rhodococcus sp. 05-2255-3B1]OZE20693.1 hypothetical protein CH255_08780 [Rhodococcus sp. 05-2255-2A2]